MHSTENETMQFSIMPSFMTTIRQYHMNGSVINQWKVDIEELVSLYTYVPYSTDSLCSQQLKESRFFPILNKSFINIWKKQKN